MWLNSSCTDKDERVLLQEEEGALSLRDDLPKNEESQTDEKSPRGSLTQEEFDFCSFGGSLLKESEMCTADEVFFQGQMLPLQCLPNDSHNNTVFKGGATCNEPGSIESSSSTSYSLQIRVQCSSDSKPVSFSTKTNNPGSIFKDHTQKHQ